MAQTPSIPKGTRDYSPEVMVKRNYVMEILRFLAEKEISTIQSSWNQVTG